MRKSKIFLLLAVCGSLYSCANISQTAINKPPKQPSKTQKENTSILSSLSEQAPSPSNTIEKVPMPNFVEKTKTLPPPVEQKPKPPPKPLDLSKIMVGDKKPVAINVQGMPAGAFVEYVLGKVLKVPFFITPQAQNATTPINLVMPVKMSPRDALKMVISALENFGLKVELKNNALYIDIIPPPPTPQPQPPLEVLYTRKALNTSAIITQIIPLHYIDPNTAINLIKNIYHSNINVNVFPKGNSIEATGPGIEIKSIIDFLNMIDIPYMKNKTPVLLHLTYWQPQDFIKQITSILQGLNIPIAQNPDQPGILFIPINYLNSVLVIPPDKKSLSVVLYWKEKLDTSSAAGSEQKAFVYKPLFNKATDLVQALQSIYSITSSMSITKTKTATINNQTPVLNSSPVISPQTAMSGGVPILGGGVGYTSPVVPPMQGAVPTSNQLSTGPQIVAFSTKDLKVAADDRNNTIIIISTPSKYKLIRGLLKELDVPPKQVLIKTIVAQITLTGQLQFGLEWYLKNIYKGGTYTISTQGLGVSSAGALVSTFTSASGNFTSLLSLLASKNKAKILSTPTLMVLNNHVASINVGTQVPVVNNIVTPLTTSITTTNEIQSVQYVNTGISLNIQPTIDSDNLVTLNIYQDVSDAEPNTVSGINSPIINTRNINTTVIVPNKGTVILGGLIQNQKTKSYTGIPLLDMIPGLKYVFGNTNIQNTRTELVIALTPIIINTTDEANRITQDVMKSLKLLKLTSPANLKY